jgi:hypothetical protein
MRPTDPGSPVPSASSEDEYTQQPLTCSMERTKLSTRQIRHALPDWLFEELVDETMPGERRTHKKTRRGHRSKQNRELGGELSPPLSPTAPGGSLLKSISSLPSDLQRCFSEWRRERKVAILQSDFYKQQEVERIMWSAYHNITQAQVY